MSEAQPESITTKQRYISTQVAFLHDVTADTAPSQYQTLSGLLRVLRQHWKTMAITAAVVLVVGTPA
jgi:hypothetical protein